MSSSDLAKHILKIIFSSIVGMMIPSKKNPAEKARLGPSHAKAEQKVMVLSIIISALLGGLWLASTTFAAPKEDMKFSSEYKSLYETSIARLEKFTVETAKLLTLNSKLTSNLETANHELALAKARSIELTLETDHLEKEIRDVTSRYFELMTNMAVVQNQLNETRTRLVATQEASAQREKEFLEKERVYIAKIKAQEVSSKSTVKVKSTVSAPTFTLSEAGRTTLINRIKKSSEVKFP